MPQKTVCQNDCDRCGRTWFSEASMETAKVVVRMIEGDSTLVDCSYDILCDSCKQTVHNLLKSLAKDMKKSAPRKPRAKKGDALNNAPPSFSVPAPDHNDAALGNIPLAAVDRGSPLVPSKKR